MTSDILTFKIVNEPLRSFALPGEGYQSHLTQLVMTLVDKQPNFNKEKALVGAFCGPMKLREGSLQALILTLPVVFRVRGPAAVPGGRGREALHQPELAAGSQGDLLHQGRLRLLRPRVPVVHPAPG